MSCHTSHQTGARTGYDPLVRISCVKLRHEMRTNGEPVGFIFGCTKHTIDECLDRRLFGSPASTTSRRLMTQISPGSPLFLFNYITRELLGPFAAVSKASMKLVPGAFDGRFPVQVKCRLSGEKLIKLQESEFKSIIKENYYNRHKFSFCLTQRQVNGLHTLMSRSTPNRRQRDFATNEIDVKFRSNSINTALPFCSAWLDKLLLTPPHLRPPLLFRRPDTVEEIPFPPSDTDRRTTICLGPLPRESRLTVTTLMLMLDKIIKSKYDFLLVQNYDRQRWCYLNFCDHQEVSYFALDSDQKSLFDLSGGLIGDHDLLKIVYWKWQGIDTLAQIFANSGCWLPKRLEMSTELYDNRPLFFNGAGAEKANRFLDQTMNDFIDNIVA